MNIFKKARLIQGMTQEEAAREIGVSIVSVCKWESGKAFPKVKRLKIIADVLHIPVSDLLKDQVEKEVS